MAAALLVSCEKEKNEQKDYSFYYSKENMNLDLQNSAWKFDKNVKKDGAIVSPELSDIYIYFYNFLELSTSEEELNNFSEIDYRQRKEYGITTKTGKVLQERVTFKILTIYTFIYDNEEQDKADAKKFIYKRFVIKDVSDNELILIGYKSNVDGIIDMNGFWDIDAVNPDGSVDLSYMPNILDDYETHYLKQ
ncbi:hypothetical protein FACS189434_08060 [Bacteroidia bacterium]|nr:hypothetical protein FACS189434_08060 [Bacteroidia bacterium]